MYHGLLEMSRLIECVTAFGPDGALQVLSWSPRMSRLIECVTAFGPDGALQVCIMVY